MFAGFPLVGLLSVFWLIVIVVFVCVLVLLVGVFAVGVCVYWWCSLLIAISLWLCWL